MPATDKLNDPLIRNAKPREKAFKLSDGGGMYLEVMPIGSKLWRLKYRFGGKEKRLSLGAYPEVSLREARAKRAELRRQLDSGKDPSVVRRVAQAEAIVRSENTFEVIARRWYAMKLPGWAGFFRHSGDTSDIGQAFRSEWANLALDIYENYYPLEEA